MGLDRVEPVGETGEGGGRGGGGGEGFGVFGVCGYFFVIRWLAVLIVSVAYRFTFKRFTGVQAVL